MAKYKKQAFAVVGVLLASTALAGCGGDDDGDNPESGAKSEKGGTLFYKIEDPMEHTDPQRIYVGRDISNTSRTVYRSLVTFGTSKDEEEGSTPIPDLATDTGTATEGGKVWSFTIRDGVKWEDGKDITCEDFKYGVSRVFATDLITGGPNYILSYLDVPKKKDGLPVYEGPYKKKGQADFDKAVTCDGKTITYRFNKPWGEFPLAIAALKMMDPYREDKDKGDKSNFEIFSNGPYKLEGKWDKQSGGTLVRNDQYDEATDETNSRGAFPEKIVFQIGETPEIIYDQIFADQGEAQSTISGNRIPASYFSKIPSAEDRYQNPNSPYADYLVPNAVKMKDVKVRKALALATDKEGWINAGGGERAYAPADSIVNPSVKGYVANPAFKDIPLGGDTAGAKALLEEAGVKIPYAIKFTYPQSVNADKQAAALKATWDKAGFKTTLDPLGDTYYDVIQKHPLDSDVVWAGWGADWPTASTVAPALFDSRPNLTPTGNGQNYGRYQSDAFEAKVDEAANAPSADDAVKPLQEADAILGEDVAYIPLEIAKFNWLWGSKVTGFDTTPASNAFPDLGLIGVSS